MSNVERSRNQKLSRARNLIYCFVQPHVLLFIHMTIPFTHSRRYSWAKNNLWACSLPALEWINQAAMNRSWVFYFMGGPVGRFVGYVMSRLGGLGLRGPWWWWHLHFCVGAPKNLFAVSPSKQRRNVAASKRVMELRQEDLSFKDPSRA